ncbi:MAG: cell division FtsA domain-containing protein, partial [Clostridia bacterium]|nr:cell division FtsA domain-containing protein [Clostridia bacterium]
RVSVLVDVGYLNTDVMIIEGDALVYLRTLPMGGGSMAADLAYGLNIPLKSAEQIKRSYMFDSDGEDEDFSVEDRDGEKKNFTRDEVKEVLEPRAEEICEAIADAIKLSGVRLTQQSAIYLTGGGLAYNRGSRELLSRFVNRPVRELRPMVRRLSGPMFTSAIGLLDYAVDEWNRDNASRGIKSFFSSLFA